MLRGAVIKGAIGAMETCLMLTLGKGSQQSVVSSGPQTSARRGRLSSRAGAVTLSEPSRPLRRVSLTDGGGPAMRACASAFSARIRSSTTYVSSGTVARGAAAAEDAQMTEIHGRG